jgi:hypothetical protein
MQGWSGGGGRAVRPVHSPQPLDFGFTLGELRFAPVRICFDVVADYAEQGKRISRRSPRKSNADLRRSTGSIISVNLRETMAILHPQSRGKNFSQITAEK